MNTVRCATVVVLYTKVVDAQCDKLATAVGRIELTTPDVPWRNSSKSAVCEYSSSETTSKVSLLLLAEIPNFFPAQGWEGGSRLRTHGLLVSSYAPACRPVMV